MYIIHYSSNKNIGYVWRGIKANFRSKNFAAPGPRPPVLKFMDLPLLAFTFRTLIVDCSVVKVDLNSLLNILKNSVEFYYDTKLFQFYNLE